MKKQLFRMVCFVVIAWLGLDTGAAAQNLEEKAVPAPVITAFKARFPGAAETKWEKTNSGKYEVKFKQTGKKAKAKFTPDGQWDSSELTKSASDLPAVAADYLKKNYAGREIDKVEWKEEAAGKQEFEVKLKKDNAGKETELTFDSGGKFLKEKKKEKKQKQ
jgi:uncharacterized protein (DUF2249 family)